MTASTFENQLRLASEAGRNAGREAAESGKYTIEELDNLVPEDVGFTEQEILLKVTNEKHLDDKDAEEIIVGLFEDTFFEAIVDFIEEERDRE